MSIVLFIVVVLDSARTVADESYIWKAKRFKITIKCACDKYEIARANIPYTRVNNHSREQNPRFARVQMQTTVHASKIYSNSKVHPGFRISFFIASIIISFFTSWLDDQQRNENGHFIQETIDICLQQGTPTAQSLELVLGLYSC